MNKMPNLLRLLVSSRLKHIIRKVKLPKYATLAAALTLLTFVFANCACAQTAAIYSGLNGNDYYAFSGNSTVANLKSSGWTTLINFGLTVQANGDITMSNNTYTLVHNGVYVGYSSWGANVASVKSAPTTVFRYEVGFGGAGDNSFANIQNLIASQGTGSSSILYQNFQALKNACPQIDAFDDDDESTFDYNSTISLAQMLNGLGYKFSIAPYDNQSFWVSVKNALGAICDVCYLQCYAGGVGNDPGQWDNAFGGGFKVTPGLESNNHSQSQWASWQGSYGIRGGFYEPDIGWAPGANWGPQEIINGIGLHSDTWEIVSLSSGLAVDVSGGGTGNGTPLIQWGYSGSGSMNWNLSWQSGPAAWKITGVNSGRAVNGNGFNNQLTIQDWTGANNQLLTDPATPGWLGYHTLIDVSNGYAWNVSGNSSSYGAAIIEWNNDGGQNSQWQFRKNQVPH